MKRTKTTIPCSKCHKVVMADEVVEKNDMQVCSKCANSHATPLDETRENSLPMLTAKSWQEFRDTGLFMFINSILHAFGWSIVVLIDQQTKMITGVYPARTKYRGYATEDTEDMHRKIGDYLKTEADELHKESR